MEQRDGQMSASVGVSREGSCSDAHHNLHVDWYSAKAHRKTSPILMGQTSTPENSLFAHVLELQERYRKALLDFVALVQLPMEKGAKLQLDNIRQDISTPVLRCAALSGCVLLILQTENISLNGSWPLSQGGMPMHIHRSCSGWPNP